METPSEAQLARYVAGDCSAAEAGVVERWCEADPAHRARLEELRAIWSARRPSRAWDAEAIWARVQGTMRQDAKRGARPGGRWGLERERPRWTVPLSAAAAVLLLAATGVAIFRSSPPSPPIREYATARGQRVTLRLPDQSLVTLAPLSRVRIPADFGRGVRELSLEGEALFEVVHDSTRPFRVLAKQAVVEDIGTRFDVRTYPEDSIVAVAVAEGAVVLGRAEPASPSPKAGAEGVVVRPGEIATLAPGGLVATARGAALAEYLAWTEGRLHFANTPLPDVLRAIGRWYDLDLRLEGPALAARSITAEFSLGSSAEMLRALALAVDARVTRSGRVVTLRPRS